MSAEIVASMQVQCVQCRAVPCNSCSAVLCCAAGRFTQRIWQAELGKSAVEEIHPNQDPRVVNGQVVYALCCTASAAGVELYVL